MAVRTGTETKTAAYFATDETLRGLFVIVTEVGLGLSPLHKIKEKLVRNLHYHLEGRTLYVLRLGFLNVEGKTLSGGFGLWDFYVRYETAGKGRLDFPVMRVLEQIRGGRWALASVASYKVTLWVAFGAPRVPGMDLNTPRSIATIAELPQNWENSGDDSGSPRTHVGSFGLDSLNVDVYRQ